MESIKVLYDIAAETGIPNEHLSVQQVVGNLIWVRCSQGSEWTAKMNKAGTRILKNLVRKEFL